MSWDPNQYLRYGGHRIRPAIELLARIETESPTSVVDLGCGTGNTTAILAERWPDADIVGVDNSDAMLAVAEHDMPEHTWIQDDVANLDSDRQFDVVFSNATLHWLDDHLELIPNLMTRVAPGGTFAMQVPDNFREPTHSTIAETVIDSQWEDKLKSLLRGWPVLSPSDYARVLAPHAATIDVWTTTYVQVLTGENPVAQWTKGSVLRPLLGALDEDEAVDFFDAYAAKVEEAYPQEANGTTLLPFRRVFAIATTEAVDGATP